MSDYPPEFNDKFKTAIRNRDEYTCAICAGSGNHVHHINYIKTDTHQLNCITLCHKCHPVTNGNRDNWRCTLTKAVACRPLIQKRPPKIVKHKESKRGSQSREEKYVHQRAYRQRLCARNCAVAINTEGNCKFDRIASSAWGPYRQRLGRNKIPHLSIPQPNSVVIVISRDGSHDLPDDLAKKLHEWIDNIPTGRMVGRTWGFGGVIALRKPLSIKVT